MSKKNKDARKVMAERAIEFAATIYRVPSPSPEETFILLAQLWKELADWLERFPGHMVYEAWVPGLGAACDALGSLEKHLKAAHDAPEALREGHAMMKQALELTKAESVAQGIKFHGKNG